MTTQSQTSSTVEPAYAVVSFFLGVNEDETELTALFRTQTYDANDVLLEDTCNEIPSNLGFAAAAFIDQFTNVVGIAEVAGVAPFLHAVGTERSDDTRIDPPV